VTVPALLDDLNPEVDQTQLRIEIESFEALRGLADAGAITATGLQLSEDIPYETAAMLAGYFGRMNRSCSWWIGDLLVYGEGAYGENFAQLAAETGLSEQTLLNRAYVCRQVAPSRRRASLAFSVHAEVASLPAKEQTHWLKRAEKDNWTRQILREHMKAKRKDEKPTLPIDPDEATVLEVAKAILRDAREADDGQHFLVPNEDIARLRSALNEDD
jgi:hypothetical protein